jgi:hypothetical protein
MKNILILIAILFVSKSTFCTCTININTEKSYNFNLIVDGLTNTFVGIYTFEKDSIISFKMDNVKINTFNFKNKEELIKIIINKEIKKLFVNKAVYKIIPINWEC